MFAIETLTKLNETDEALSRHKRLKALTELAEDMDKFERKLLAEPEEIRLFQDLVDSGLAWSLVESFQWPIDVAISKGLVKENAEDAGNV